MSGLTSGLTATDGPFQFETLLLSWNLPKELTRELIEYHTKLSYAPGALIFGQGAPADILFWVIKGVVKESCPGPNGSRVVVRLAAAGDVLGLADELNDKGNWVRRFEAQAMSKCVLAMITRQHVRDLLKSLDAATVLDIAERVNAAWAGWVHHYASFLGLSFRERLELVLIELARKFGVEESEGILLTFEPGHADLAEMIGSSRPMVSRLMAELATEGEITRRSRLYILSRSGTLAARLARQTAVARAEIDSPPERTPPSRRKVAA
jgi:CRP/FNR family transcriptional regulator, cyclic AMP receptor protein